MKKEIPILMSAPMVQAIINGTKTMTRRVIKQIPPDVFIEYLFYKEGKYYRAAGINGCVELGFRCRYGNPGDVLFVRESWRLKGWHFEDSEAIIGYADGEEIQYDTPDDDNDLGYQWVVKQFEKLVQKDIVAPVDGDDDTEEDCRMEFTSKEHPFSPSIHLPKWCSRIWLEVTDVRVERLHDITEEDAIAEGIEKQYSEPEIFKPYNEKVLQPPVESPEEIFQELWETINGKESWDVNPWVWVISFKVLSTTGKP